MWKKVVLGDSTHESLLNTSIFYNGLYFALRSGKEHHQLSYSPCQIQLIEQPGLRTYLQYTGNVSKNHPGGLRRRKITQKCHSNTKRWFGYKTNHSLPATITSRMYHVGMEEQVIMKQTRHRTTEGVRSYKRTSKQAASGSFRYMYAQ